MAYIMAVPLGYQFEDANGAPLVGGTLEFYVTGTSTATPIYFDSAGSASAATVTLNSLGRPQTSGGTATALFFDTSVTYKLMLKDSTGTQIDPVYDPFNVIPQAASVQKSFDDAAAFIAADNSGFSYLEIRSYRSGWAGSSGGPLGRLFVYYTGGSNSSPTNGTAVSVSKIGGGDGTGSYTGQASQSGFFYDAAGREYEMVTGNSASLLQFGAYGDGSTDDQAAFNRAQQWLTSAEGRHLRLTGNRTYLISAGNDMTNASGYSFKISGDGPGTVVKLASFTGSEWFHCFHNPGGNNSFWDNIPYDVIISDLTIDANGYNQNFAFAAELRDGTGGTINATYNTTTGQAQRAATADVFGNSLYSAFKISDSATSTASTYAADLVRISGARSVTYENIILKNRHEEGLVGFNCQTVNFINCHDYDGLPTNDQFVINMLNNGSDPGQQHTAFKAEKCWSAGVLRASAAIADGATVVGQDSDTTATVQSTTSGDIYVYNCFGGKGFKPGETLSINGSTAAGTTVTSFILWAAPVMNVSDCTSRFGNTGASFINTQGSPLGSVLNVSNWSSFDVGTAHMRVEHVHTINLSNVNFVNSHILTDPTKQLNYASQNGLNMGGDVAVVNWNGVNLTNCVIDLESVQNEITHQGSGINVYVNDIDPIDNIISESPDSVTAVTVTGEFTGVNVRGEVSAAGFNPIDVGIENNLGSLTKFKVDGARIAVRSCEKMSEFEIKNCDIVANNIIALASIPAPVIRNGVIDACVEGFVLGGTSQTCVVKFADVHFKDMQQYCIRGTDSDILVLHIAGCTFQNWGLDTGAATTLRSAITGSSSVGVGAVHVKLVNPTFIRTDSDGSLSKITTTTTCDNYYLGGTTEIDSVSAASFTETLDGGTTKTTYSYS